MARDDRFRAPKPNQLPEPPTHIHVWSPWGGAFSKQEQYRRCMVKGCPEVETKIVAGK